jgi:multiple sugar transport system substrate-binding protein
VKGLLSAGCLALTLLTVVSCGGGGDDEIVVRFWGLGREGEVVRELIPAFEAANPGVRIEAQQIPWTAAHEKLLTGFVGRATPDVAQIGNTWVPELVALGALAPLDEGVAASEVIDRSDYFAGVWDTNVVDGATYGLPWYVDTRLLFYRADLVGEGTGIAWPPRSWAEWRAAMEELRERGGADDYAILLPIDEWAQPVILGLQRGATLLDREGRHGHFSDPRFRAAMAWYAGLFEDGLAPPLDLSTLANLYQQFADGELAMVVTGPWNVGEFRRRLGPDEQHLWATAPLPPPEEGMEYPGASLAGGSSLVVFRHPSEDHEEGEQGEQAAARRKAAWRWVEYLSAPEQQLRFQELTGNLPARRSVWKRSGLADDPKVAPFLVQLENAVPTPKVPEWERIATRVAQAAEQVVRGGRDLDEALAALDADVDRMLEKRRYLLDRREERDEGGGP